MTRQIRTVSSVAGAGTITRTACVAAARYGTLQRPATTLSVFRSAVKPLLIRVFVENSSKDLVEVRRFELLTS